MVEAVTTVLSRATDDGATHPGALVLRVCGSHREGQIIRLKSAKCTIGSGEHCTLRIRARGVQPLHCVLIRKAARTIVRRWAADTRLNGASFTDAPLDKGDRLSIGPIDLEVLESGTIPNRGTPADRAAPEGVSDGVAKRDSVVEHLRTAKDLGRKRTEKVLRRLRQAYQRIEDLTNELASQCTDGGVGGGQEEVVGERRAELEVQREEMAHAREELDSLREAVEKQRESVEGDQAEVELQSKKIESARVELDRERQHLEQVRAELAAKQEELDRAAEQAAGDHEKSEEVETLRAELEVQREEMAHAREELDSLRETIGKQREAVEGDRVEVDRRSSEMESARVGFDLERQRLEEVRSELAAKQEELDRAAEQAAGDHEKSEEAAALRAELEVQREEMARAREELDSLRETVEKQRESVEGDQAEVELQSKKIESARVELDRERQRLEQVRAELAAKQEELDRAAEQAAGDHEKSEEAAALRAKLDVQRDEVARAREELDSLREAVEKQRESVEGDQAEVERRSGIVAQEAAELQVERVAFAEAQQKWEAAQLDAQKQIKQRAEQLDLQKEILDEQREALASDGASWEALREEAEAKLAARAEQLDAREHELDDRTAEFERIPHHSADSTCEPSDSGELAFLGDAQDGEVSGHSTTSFELFKKLEAGSNATQPLGEFSELCRATREDGPEGEASDSETMLVLREENDTAQPTVSEILLADPVIADSFIPESSEDRSPASDPAQSAESDEEQSIEQYMAGLLARVNSDSDSQASPTSVVERPESTAPPCDDQQPASPDEGDSPRDSQAEEESQVTSPAPALAEVFCELEESGPRVRAAERAVDLVSLRELANLSAQSALDTHDRLRLIKSIHAKLAVVALALATAGVLFYRWSVSPGSPMYYYMGLAVILVAIVWGTQYAALSAYAYLAKRRRTVLDGGKSVESEERLPESDDPRGREPADVT